MNLEQGIELHCQPLVPTQHQPYQLSHPCCHCADQYFDNNYPIRKVQFAEHADVISEHDMADLKEFAAAGSNLAVTADEDPSEN